MSCQNVPNSPNLVISSSSWTQLLQSSLAFCRSTSTLLSYKHLSRENLFVLFSEVRLNSLVSASTSRQLLTHLFPAIFHFHHYVRAPTMASPQLPPPSGSPEDTESGWQFVQRPTVSFTSLRTSGEQYLRRDSDTISDHGMHHDIRQEHFDCCHETENVNTSVEPAPEPDEATFVEYTRPASALLRVMSLLDPELIGSHLLFPVSATAEQCGYPATARNFTIARDELRQKSLISLTPGGNGLCMQRHIQDEVVTQLQANDQFCVFFVVVVEMVAASWPSGVTLQRPDESPQNRYSRWMNCEGLLPHVLKLKQTFEGMDNVDAKTCTTHHLVLLSIEVAW